MTVVLARPKKLIQFQWPTICCCGVQVSYLPFLQFDESVPRYPSKKDVGFWVGLCSSAQHRATPPLHARIRQSPLQHLCSHIIGAAHDTVPSPHCRLRTTCPVTPATLT